MYNSHCRPACLNMLSLSSGCCAVQYYSGVGCMLTMAYLTWHNTIGDSEVVCQAGHPDLLLHHLPHPGPLRFAALHQLYHLVEGDGPYLQNGRNYALTFLPAGMNHTPNFLLGGRNHTPTFLLGGRNDTPTFLPGERNHTHTFLPGGRNHTPIFLPVGRNHTSTLLPGGRNHSGAFLVDGKML